MLLEVGRSLSYQVLRMGEILMMDMKDKIKIALEVLEATSIEKVNRFGVKASLDDLDRIKDMVDELVCFWELDENLMDEYDEKIKELTEYNYAS